MAKEVKEGTFVLFSNENKLNENSADFIGKMKINGKLHRLAMWKKKKYKSEVEFFSGCVNEFKTNNND